jgi:hypothetical protein
VDRLKSDYRKTFGSAHGKHVLMDLYQRCHGVTPTLPLSGNPFEMAVNEGKRVALLYIVDKLKVEDTELREMLERHNEEKRREVT